MHPSSRRSNEAQNIPRRRRHRRGAGAHRLRRRERRQRRRLVGNRGAHDREARRCDHHRVEQPVPGRLVRLEVRATRMVIFESLALVNPTGDLGTTPWLAESVEWNDDYTQLTAVARSGVKWSDGEDFTADDIAFSFNQVLDGKLNDTNALDLKSVNVDGDTVTIDFNSSKYTQQARVLHFQIVPEHIWSDIEDPNTDPLTGEGQVVGTGPYVLDSWTTESVTLTANPDYWGGELAVPELNYVSYGDNAALTTALVYGRGGLGAGVHPADRGQLPGGRRGQPLPRLAHRGRRNAVHEPADQAVQRPGPASGAGLDDRPPGLRRHRPRRRERGDLERHRSRHAARGRDHPRVRRPELLGRRRQGSPDPHRRRLHLGGREARRPRRRGRLVLDLGPRRLERLEHRAGAHRRGAQGRPRHRGQGRPARLGRLGCRPSGGHVPGDHPLARGHRQRLRPVHLHDGPEVDRRRQGAVQLRTLRRPGGHRRAEHLRERVVRRRP